MGFQSKLLAGFILLLGTVMGFLIFFHVQSEKSLLKEADGNLRELLDIVAHSGLGLMGRGGINRENLDPFIAEFSKRSDIFEVAVLDNRQNVIASSDNAVIGRKRPRTGGDINSDVMVREQIEMEDSLESQTRYQIRVPLVQNKEVLGTLEVSVLLNDLRYSLKRLHLKHSLIFLTALVFAFGVFSFLLHRLHKPFRLMGEAAKRVGGGDLGVRLESHGQDEESEMAASFNAMVKRLSEQRHWEERLHYLERRAFLAELAANLAHEIRNPLNLINLTLHHLSKQFIPEKDERKTAFLKQIDSLKEEVRHLNNVVTGFLSLGRPAKLHKVRFKAKALLDEVTLLVRQQLSDKLIHFQTEFPLELEVHADPEQLRLVLLNLLLNAIEAVPAHGLIRFSAQKSGEDVVCRLADNGIGIRPEDLESVFEPYFTRKEGGIGLGLSLARRIVEGHGGIIAVRNGETGGAQFEFSVPEKAEAYA